MDILNRFKVFFLSVVTRISQVLPRAASLQPLPTAPPTTTDIQHEAIAEQHPPPVAPVVNQYNLDWAMIMIGVCLPSAVEIALQSLQIETPLPPLFHFVCLAIMMSFTLLFVSKFMSWKFPTTAQVLEQFGVLFAVTAIFVAVTIPLPPWLKLVTWIVYTISLIAIIICIICTRF